MSVLKKLVNRVSNLGLTSSPDESVRGREFLEVGFHGDEYLLILVDRLITSCDWFIETGANVGSTVAYVGRNYPEVTCISCEPDDYAYERAIEHTQDLSNVTVFHESSIPFLRRLRHDYAEAFPHDVLLWIDAHGHGFEWPLREEVEFISSHFERGYMFIDDFQVPHNDEFGYDVYEGQECSLEYIEDSIRSDWTYQLYYPNYSEHTSSHHPLRGWGLFAFGEDRIEFPDDVSDVVRPVD